MLWKKPNAELTTQPAWFIENYNLILVGGTMFVKNPAVDAFKNIKAAELRLKQNAQLVVKE